jgi:hypothetical protein
MKELEQFKGCVNNEILNYYINVNTRANNQYIL